MYFDPQYIWDTNTKFVSKYHLSNTLPNEEANSKRWRIAQVRQTRSVVDVSVGEQQKLQNFNSTMKEKGVITKDIMSWPLF